MKLITLNIWGGQVFEPLIDFLKKHSKDTDIFCFQEVLFGTQNGFTPVSKARINVFAEIEKSLEDFVALTYHAPEGATYFQNEPLPDSTRAGQAIFLRKSIQVVGGGGLRGYQGGFPKGATYGAMITSSCQWVKIQVSDTQTLTIANLHGLHQGEVGKIDTPERLMQSKIIKDFLDPVEKKILCGDFNLLPDGKSIEILEQGMTNLVKKYGVTSTRSPHYRHYETGSKFADYILISAEVKVKDFKVLQDEVSDHLPLLLEFE